MFKKNHPHPVPVLTTAEQRRITALHMAISRHDMETLPDEIIREAGQFEVYLNAGMPGPFTQFLASHVVPRSLDNPAQG